VRDSLVDGWSNLGKACSVSIAKTAFQDRYLSLSCPLEHAEADSNRNSMCHN
jgi:hypothetical protein